jgi:hypothetical protein
LLSARSSSNIKTHHAIDELEEAIAAAESAVQAAREEVRLEAGV